MIGVSSEESVVFWSDTQPKMGKLLNMLEMAKVGTNKITFKKINKAMWFRKVISILSCCQITPDWKWIERCRNRLDCKPLPSRAQILYRFVKPKFSGFLWIERKAENTGLLLSWRQNISFLVIKRRGSIASYFLYFLRAFLFALLPFPESLSFVLFLRLPSHLHFFFRIFPALLI